MAKPIKDLKSNGEKFYPTTVSTAVFRPDGTVPTTYQRWATDSNVTSVWNTIEVFEV